MVLPAQVELVDLHIQVLPEQQALLGQMVRQEQQVVQEQLVLPVMMGQLAQRARVPLALPVIQEVRVAQAQMAQLEPQDQRV